MTNWRTSGNSAVIFGGANGIGLAAAARFLQDGMTVLIADQSQEYLTSAAQTLAEISGGRLHTCVCDVSDFEQVDGVRDRAFELFETVNCLMNNAGISLRTGKPWENLQAWRKITDINFWGIAHGCQAFIPDMLEARQPGVIINTGSKQGITNPPGNYGYNLAKAGVRAYSESLAHALGQQEDCQLSAHLLIPGFTYTNMIAQHIPEKPAGAWTADQVVDFMLPRIDANDFYILCPDNDVTREMDEKRIQWNTDDILKNRPALSRWHPDYEAEFADYMK